MIRPIVLYDNQLLRQIALPIDRQNFDSSIITDMFETLENATGVGLAAPQIGLSIRLFIVNFENHRKVFINPIKISESGVPKIYNEGCLSLPSINNDVIRPSKIKLSYYDENWNYLETDFNGALARIIQHEYSHLEGELIIDKMNLTQKILNKNKLKLIQDRKIKINYPFL